MAYRSDLLCRLFARLTLDEQAQVVNLLVCFGFSYRMMGFDIDYDMRMIPEQLLEAGHAGLLTYRNHHSLRYKVAIVKVTRPVPSTFHKLDRFRWTGFTGRNGRFYFQLKRS